MKKKWEVLLVLTPSSGVIMTLVIASPINYWPRYGMAAQLMIPFFIIMSLLIFYSEAFFKEEKRYIHKLRMQSE